MKLQSLFAAAIVGAAAIATTSCSNEEHVEGQSATQAEVKFKTNITAMTRSVTTGSSLKQFKTTAFLKQDNTYNTFMNTVVSQANGEWVTADKYVWPYNGSLTFYSVAPSTLNTTMPAADDYERVAPTFTFTAASDAANQSDVLYAVNADHQFTGSLASSIVNVNFRHALSQVVFKAKCENTQWEVSISDVKVHNLKSSGVYTLPMQTTAPLTNNDDVRGSWDLADELHSYNTGLESPVKNISEDVVELTSSSSLPLLLLPQSTTAWDPKNDPKCAQKGSYFTIRCQLQQKTSDGNKIIIWPASGVNAYVDIAIPVAVNWEEGKKYTYTFNFKEGAGYIPPTQTEGGNDVVPGANVLHAVQFNVTVDDYQNTNSEIRL
ncbi:MAG: fimbrillin family protein [Bacteroidales bacterium]|nr:fimbrillin family protein [Candidatus Physcousia equi]